MNLTLESKALSRPSTFAEGNDVWTRVWRHVPSDEKDDTLLARERTSARWLWLRENLLRSFGTLKGLRTIELGSGRADISVLLAEEGARTTLLDANAMALHLADQRYGRLGLEMCQVQGDLRHLPESIHGRFDVALSIGVIEHFQGEERTEVLRAHYRALRPGGMVMISVPNAWCLPYRAWKGYLELRGWWPYGMEIPYARAELARRGSKAGFVGVEVRGFGFHQSLSEHWIKRLTGHRPRWAETPSILDSWLGLALVMVGRREGAA